MDTLRGKVLDSKTGEALTDQLEIFQKENRPAALEINPLGEFKLKIDTNGKRSIEVSAPGYKTRSFLIYFNGKPQEFALSKLEEVPPQENQEAQDSKGYQISPELLGELEALKPLLPPGDMETAQQLLNLENLAANIENEEEEKSVFNLIEAFSVVLGVESGKPDPEATKTKEIETKEAIPIMQKTTEKKEKPARDWLTIILVVLGLVVVVVTIFLLYKLFSSSTTQGNPQTIPGSGYDTRGHQVQAATIAPITSTTPQIVKL